MNQYTISDIQRNYPELRNPPLYLENFNAKENFYIGERWKAILSVDYFNAFNRTQRTRYQCERRHLRTGDPARLQHK